MPGISIHVVDVAAGVVAKGMMVRVERLQDGARSLLCDGSITAAGTLAELDALAAEASAGIYEATFSVAAYYRQQGATLPDLPFLGDVTYRFGLSDAAQHYHLPFKMTPWGFSCFRGGA